MKSYTDKEQDNQSHSETNNLNPHKNSHSNFQLTSQPAAISQRKLQDMANNSPQVQQVSQLQAKADKFTAQQKPIVQMSGGNNAFLAGQGAYWHVHYDHVKYGKDDGTRINFSGRTAKQIRKQLKEVKGRTPISKEGRLTYHQCINYIDKHC